MAAADTEQAYTYAWWLTGEERAAQAAVECAARDLDATNGERLPALLALIRAAVPERTMCPASELALLHDGQGLALDDAARIAAVPPADARSELAHGRLEALRETVTVPFDHPERLGGLAVGNPADVAHARQCESCAAAQGLLVRGRDELARLPVPPLPPDLSAPGPTPPRDRRGLWAAAAVLALLGGGIAWASAAGPPAQPDVRTNPLPASDTASGRIEVVIPAAPEDPGEPGAFRVTGAALVGPTGQPVTAAPRSPHETLRLAVRYEGAAAGVVLSAHWSVGGERFRDLRVVLSGRRSTHVFGGPAPAEGWPSGAHEVVLAVDGEVVGAVGFTVAG